VFAAGRGEQQRAGERQQNADAADGRRAHFEEGRSQG
jgi:hypothetical protein